MTKQEAFDKVLTTIRQRGYTRARNTNNKCVMCTPSGLQCAVGILGEAAPNTGAPDVWATAVAKLPDALHDAEKVSFLYDLQHCHDCTSSDSSFEAAMRETAEEHGLRYLAPQAELLRTSCREGGPFPS